MAKFFVSIRDEHDMTICADHIVADDAASARVKLGFWFLETALQRRELFGSDTRMNLDGCRVIARRSALK